MDWLASIIGITARILAAHRLRFCWVLSFFNNIIFTKIALDNELYGIIPLSIVQAFLSVYGFWKWGQDD